MLTGRRMDAHEALRIGLVADVVDEPSCATARRSAHADRGARAVGCQADKAGIWSALEIPSSSRDRVRGSPADHGHVQPRCAEAAARSSRSVRRVRRLDERPLRRIRQDRARHGGSRGIGLMIAEGLVRAGASVIVSSARPRTSRPARRSRGLGECQAITGDVSSPQGAAELARATREIHPSLDILVNNAGVVWGAPLEDFPAVGWEKIMHTTSRASSISPSSCCRRCGCREPAGPGRVINIGSIDGLRTPGPRTTATARARPPCTC